MSADLPDLPGHVVQNINKMKCWISFCDPPKPQRNYSVTYDGTDSRGRHQWKIWNNTKDREEGYFVLSRTKGVVYCCYLCSMYPWDGDYVPPEK